MDLTRYNFQSLHGKINLRSHLEPYNQLSTVAKRSRPVYYRASRPYKNNLLGCTEAPYQLPNNLSKVERFEFKF